MENPRADRMVTCPFCSLTSWIPERVRAGIRSVPPTLTWWVVFSGSSAQRAELLKNTDEHSIDAPLKGQPTQQQRLLSIAAAVLFPLAALVLIVVLVLVVSLGI